MNLREARYKRLITVLLAWAIAMLMLLISLALWGLGVPQVATWQATFPAIGLVASLFSITACLFVLHERVAKRLVIPTSLAAAAWSLAIAIGI